MSAAKALFDLGLAGSAGCEYRALTVTTGSVWGAVSATKVHGFLMPAPPDEKRHFAILWNGLVYPVAAVGSAADLKGDVDALVKTASDERIKSQQDFPGMPSFRNIGRSGRNRRFPKKRSPRSRRACCSVSAKRRVAEELWTEYAAGATRHFADKPDDPFLAAFCGLIWARFDRAITAHMRGDDRLVSD